jgi:hypothetical protein
MLPEYGDTNEHMPHLAGSSATPAFFHTFKLHDKTA